eukprot:TRINITY_DN7296_c0_g1_i1.p1 TRINITY_DN7296_c0_g1~~TRINITY_DN7296_c0_g1_i1.p1  ORF type:complete len:265 (-),score=27.58 TRINITY_DN7296_c0_g1_i1:258-1052(-)
MGGWCSWIFIREEWCVNGTPIRSGSWECPAKEVRVRDKARVRVRDRVRVGVRRARVRVADLVATAGMEGSVGLHDLRTLQQVGTLCTGEQGCCYSAHIGTWNYGETCPDQPESIVVGCQRGAEIWDTRQPAQPVMRLGGHALAVMCGTRSGDMVVTGSKDGTAKVWDVSGNAARSLATLSGHGAGVRAVRSGSWRDRTVFTGSNDCTVRRWRLPEETEEAEATESLVHKHEAQVTSLILTRESLISSSMDGSLKKHSFRNERTP